MTLEPVANHLLLQLAAYVALLVASKMGEVAPLRMKSLANLTGRMFTPLQVFIAYDLVHNPGISWVRLVIIP